MQREGIQINYEAENCQALDFRTLDVSASEIQIYFSLFPIFIHFLLHNFTSLVCKSKETHTQTPAPSP